MICLTTVLDGVYIGTNRVRDYITVSVLSTAAAWAYYARVAIPRGLGVRGTWNGLFIFCAVRALFHAVKVEKGDLYRYAIGGLDYNAEEGKV
jgi:Na+-driven multidrug efflux pump